MAGSNPAAWPMSELRVVWCCARCEERSMLPCAECRKIAGEPCRVSRNPQRGYIGLSCNFRREAYNALTPLQCLVLRAVRRTEEG